MTMLVEGERVADAGGHGAQRVLEVRVYRAVHLHTVTSKADLIESRPVR